MLIVLMLSMLGISATLLGSAPLFWHTSSVLEQREVLAKTKTALISYAVNYIDLYGPRGAGLGHFPCPDTDNGALRTSWRYDGPNPPCGNGVVAEGKLPRHLTALTGRYSFHQQTTQELLYSVSTRYINNPSNRIVNPDTSSDIQAFSDHEVLVRISYPQNVNHSAQAISIKRNEIHREMVRRAADWVLSKLPVQLQHPHYTYATDCQHIEEVSILYWISNEQIYDTDCDLQVLALRESTALVDGVPYLSHWFFRNQWYNYVTVELSPTCSSLAVGQCSWRVEFLASDDTAYIRHVSLDGQVIR